MVIALTKDIKQLSTIELIMFFFSVKSEILSEARSKQIKQVNFFQLKGVTKPPYQIFMFPLNSM